MSKKHDKETDRSLSIAPIGSGRRPEEIEGAVLEDGEPTGNTDPPKFVSWEKPPWAD